MKQGNIMSMFAAGVKRNAAEATSKATIVSPVKPAPSPSKAPLASNVDPNSLSLVSEDAPRPPLSRLTKRHKIVLEDIDQDEDMIDVHDVSGKKPTPQPPVIDRPSTPVLVSSENGPSPAISQIDEASAANSPKPSKTKKDSKEKNCKTGKSRDDGPNAKPVSSKAKAAPAALGATDYDATAAATWKPGEDVPYSFLANAFDAIEKESSRLKITELLCNIFRSIIAVSPNDLLPAVYLSVNRVAPEYEGKELGVGEGLLIKAICESTGRTAEFVKKAYADLGCLGLVAGQSRGKQNTLMRPKPLTIRRVFSDFKAIADMSGNASGDRKRGKIHSLIVASQGSEPIYLVKSLLSKLRIGLAEQTVLASLGRAMVFEGCGEANERCDDDIGGKTPIGDMASAEFATFLVDAEKQVKTIYCEMPTYDRLIPALLQYGVRSIHRHCFLSVGIPSKPMLAKPTKGISEVLDRFNDTRFICEYKYDGERAQIHRNEQGVISIFSRNLEDNTTKYPDLVEAISVAALPTTSTFILDCESVAYDRINHTILPFQHLSHRSRKDVEIEDVKVQCVVFAFDILYLNGESIVRQPLLVRRQRLQEAFVAVPDRFFFAMGTETNDIETIQTMLEEAVAEKCEGLMVKTLDKDANYEPARRSNKWLKVKKDYLSGLTDSFDLVPIGAYLGRGKRTGVYGAYLLCCYDPDTEQYQSCCKVGTGFKDDVLLNLTESLKSTIIPKPRSYYSYSDQHACDVWFDASVVWEVQAADLQVSPEHRAAVGLVDPAKGVGLRFPRFLRARTDKNCEDATTAEQVAEMFKRQASVQGSRADDGDDFDI